MKKWKSDNKEHVKEYDKQWRRDNFEYDKQRQSKWREENKKHISKCNENNYQKNRENILKYKKDNYPKDKERILEYAHNYYRGNKEKIGIKNKEWGKNNPGYHKQWQKTEKGKANSQRGQTLRRTREKNIINTLTSQEWLDILEENNYRCVYCGVEFNCENLPTKDHITPLSKGGDNVKENIVPACRSCNSKKNNKIIKKKEMAIC